MSLFSNVEIDPKISPYIQKGEGVGIVKIDGFGKCSAIVDGNQIIITSYDSGRSFKVDFAEINLLSYNQGNFINEPKMHIGTPGKHYVLAGVDNNDEELERFYNTVLNIKDREQQGQQHRNNQGSHRSGMPHPNPNITNPNKQPHHTQNEFIPNNSFDDIPSGGNSMDDYEPSNDFTNYENQTPEDEAIPPKVQKDPVDEIRRYYELKEDGIITEEEFNKKKKQLLGI